MERIILVGFGGHAKSVIDIIEQTNQFCIEGYTDINTLKDYKEYKWLGKDEELEKYYKAGTNNIAISVGYMGNSKIREKLYRIVKKIGFKLPIIMDKSVILANNVRIGEGTFIGKGAIINADSEIGKVCIINSGTLIEHESIIEDYSHIAVGAVLCGNVHIGKYTFIGANATVIQGVTIGKGCIIGAGSVILNDVDDNKTVYGVYNG